jgi:hypothetical protein
MPQRTPPAPASALDDWPIDAEDAEEASSVSI